MTGEKCEHSNDGIECGGHHVARTGAEGFVGVGGIAFFGWRLSRDRLFMARESVDVYRRHDAQPLYRAWHFPADGSAQSLGESQPHRFRSMVSFAHGAVMAVMAFQS